MELIKKYGAILFLGLLLILGFIIRAEGLFSNNVLFLYDSARDFLFTKNIVVDHRIYLIGPPSGGLQGYFHGVLWYYILAIPFMLGNGHPLAGTVFMIFGSLASVLLTFFLMRKISNTHSAFLASTFFALSAFSIATSRFTWNPYPIVWLMPIYYYFTYQYFNKNYKKQVFIWIALLSGLFLHFEAVYGIPLLLPLLILAILELRKKKFKQVLIGALLFVIPMLPSLLFDLRHNFLISGNILKVIVSGGESITHDNEITPIATRFILRTNDLFTYTINSLSQNVVINVLLFVVALFAVRHLRRPFLYFALSVLLTPFFFFLTMKYAVWSYYWIGQTPFFVLLISHVVGSFSKKYITAATIVVLFVFSGYLQDLSVHKNGYVDKGAQNLSTQIAAADVIYTDAGTAPFSVYVLTPPVYDYVYRYIFWWRGNTLYHHYPNDEKQKIFYLLIEKNPNDPNGEYFIKKVLHTETKPVKTWTFPDLQIKKFHADANEAPVDPNIFPQN